MGLFDKLKDAAAPLVDKAKDKVGDVTGLDTDKLLDAADHVVDAQDDVTAAAADIREGRTAH